MTSVAGIDLALASTGVTRLAWDADGRRQAKTFQVKSQGHAGATLEEASTRLRDICRRVIEACGWPDLAVIEAPNYGRGQQAGSHDVSGLWWLVVDTLLTENVPVAQVSPSTLKVYVVGFGGAPGKPVKKADMLRAVQQRYPDLLTGGVHDVADSIGLAAMGARHLGRPIDDLPTTHLRALTSVRWPQPLRPNEIGDKP